MILSATMWDDALVTDLKLLDILRDMKLTANFAISPSRHGTQRVPNDSRSSYYGKLVSRSELIEFSDFEISNHTYSHLELTKLSKSEIEREIKDGKNSLSDLFNREIDGFCYPYGCYNRSISDTVKNMGHSYARTTKEKSTRIDIKNPCELHTTCRWSRYREIEMSEGGLYIFWGHTYEIQDWTLVKLFYQHLKSFTKVVTFSELVRHAEGNGWKCFL